ncbi:MAG: amidohydrolase family protein [Polyangia bacterium]
MKIDLHVHLDLGSPPGGNFFRGVSHRVGSWYLRRRLKIGKTADPRERERCVAERLSALVRGSEIDRAVLLAFDAVHSPNGEIDPKRTLLHVSNDAAARVCARAPDAFLLGASVHPARPDALEELHRAREMGAVLVKLLPNTHGFDPADPSFVPYWRELAELNLPLLVHGGYEHTLPAIEQSFGDPARLRPVLDQGATVIVAHCGSAGRFHRSETFGAFLELATRYPSCLGDTSSLTNFWRSRYLFDLLDPERLAASYDTVPDDPLSVLVHGSDFPIPITTASFIGRTPRAERRRSRRKKNPLQLDVDLKRMAGLPDEVLTRAHRRLGIGARS